MGLDWNPKGTRTIESLVAQLKGGQATAPTSGGPPPPPSMAPPPPTFELAPASESDAGLDRAALFAQINVGEDITKRLKKVDKNAPKKEVVSQEHKQQKVQTQQKQQAVQKPPRKYLRENWFVENFENERLIEFKEDEIDMRQSLFLDNCVNCGVIVKHKIKAIFLNNCKKIQLVFGQTVTGLEIVKTKRVQEDQDIYMDFSCPSMTIDGSEQVHVTFNQSRQCDIVSAKTMDLNITYLQPDGELAKDNTVPEQFVTTFDEDLKKWVTKPLDIFL